MYLTISNLTSYFFSSCSLTGCTREFLTLKKLKHHEKIHEGKFVPEQWISLKACAQVKPSSFCGRLPLWDWRVSFSGKNLVKLSEAQKRTQRYKWNSRKHWCHVTHASCKTLTTPLVSDKVLCGQCNKLFSNFWFLRLHELRVHSGGKRMFPCPKEGCEKKFTRRFNLESHVLGDHEGKKPFSCAVPGCNKSFAMKVNLHFSV